MIQNTEIHIKIKTASPINGGGQTEWLNVVYLYLPSCIKLCSKWIRDFNIKPVTVNLIDEKVGNSLEVIGTEADFLMRTLIVQALGSTISK